jgi:carbamoylphosphate synthase large subunit
VARILVTGIGGPAGRTVAEMLLARGHYVVGVDARGEGEPGVKTPGAAFFQVPLAAHPRFLEELAATAGREEIELVIPTVTEELPVIARYWNRFSRVPAMIAPADPVEVADDKHATCRRLSDLGVAVPRFCLPSEVRSFHDVERTLGWPCLSKPRRGRGGRGVAVRQPSDWPAVEALDDSFVLQEFLPGTDYDPNLLMARAGESAPLVVVLEKTRLKEGIVGNAAEVRRAHAPDVTALAAATGRALGFVGPLDLDVRRGRDGRPAVIDINARFGANIASAPEILDAALSDWGFGS